MSLLIWRPDRSLRCGTLPMGSSSVNSIYGRMGTRTQCGVMKKPEISLWSLYQERTLIGPDGLYAALLSLIISSP